MSRFAAGEAVRVKSQFPPGHVRTPYYCRGKAGTVERICGAFRNPEKLAYGTYDAEKVTLYRVRFAHRELWGGAESPDAVEIELYEHWLESAG